MKVNVKKLDSNAVLPTYAKHGDAGMDLTATSKSYDEHGNVVYGTGLAIEVPQGHYAQLLPRSSISKYDLVLANSVGVIDSGYRGELIVKFKPTQHIEDLGIDVAIHNADHVGAPIFYNIGDRIGQIIIMPYPKVEFNLVNELSTTDRGIGGFGSTDPVTASIESNYDVEEDKELNAIADSRKGQKRISVDIEDL